LSPIRFPSVEAWAGEHGFHPRPLDDDRVVFEDDHHAVLLEDPGRYPTLIVRRRDIYSAQ
jgi:hypothetical protein